MVAAVRGNGVPVEYVVVPDEGHGFAWREDQIAGYGAVVGCFGRYVRDRPVTQP